VNNRLTTSSAQTGLCSAFSLYSRLQDYKIEVSGRRFGESHDVWLIGLKAGHCQLKVRDIESSPEAGKKRSQAYFQQADC